MSEHAASIKRLQDERAQLLADRRQWERLRKDAAAKEEACETRLKLVEAALEGVDLGIASAAQAPKER